MHPAYLDTKTRIFHAKKYAVRIFKLKRSILTPKAKVNSRVITNPHLSRVKYPVKYSWDVFFLNISMTA